MSSDKGPVWLNLKIALKLNEQVLEGTNESSGVRGEGTSRLQEALVRPESQYRFGGVSAIPRLAAHYAEAITGKHPFNGGNKRTSLAAAATFMHMNGRDIEACFPPAEKGEKFDHMAYKMIKGLSTGKLSVRRFGDWLEAQSLFPPEPTS